MEELKIEDYLEYDKTSSTCVRWKKLTKSCKSKIGDEWGSSGPGYRRGIWNKKIYYVHRVVYYLHYGIWSDRKMVINHKDNNRSNNRIDNLELIDSIENTSHQNRSINSNNTSGYRGIQITLEGYYKVCYGDTYRGTTKTLEEGRELYRKCVELDKQGITYRQISKGKNKNI